MAGLCSTGQMALELGNWDVVAFEKDTITWKLACDVIRRHIALMDSKEQAFVNQVSSNVELVKAIEKAKREGWAKLDDDGIVSFFLIFTLLIAEVPLEPFQYQT